MFDKKNIIIRTSSIKDKIKIARLHHTLWRSTTAHFIDEAIFDTPHSFFIDKWKKWLVEENKLLLGFLTFEAHVNNYPEIQFIYVAQKYRYSKR